MAKTRLRAKTVDGLCPHPDIADGFFAANCRRTFATCSIFPWCLSDAGSSACTFSSAVRCALHEATESGDDEADSGSGPSGGRHTGSTGSRAPVSASGHASGGQRSDYTGGNWSGGNCQTGHHTGGRATLTGGSESGENENGTGANGTGPSGGGGDVQRTPSSFLMRCAPPLDDAQDIGQECVIAKARITISGPTLATSARLSKLDQVG